ncbi:MAG: hypothetical protein CMM37_08240 [Rhodospirillaceae bacterium]|nr:hypothetical protein [Rhodospirillaceae bacterium]
MICKLWTYKPKKFLICKLAMKMIFIIIIFLYSVVSSNSLLAEWVPIAKDKDGTTTYINFKSIKKSQGRVFWWALDDRIKPSKRGTKSAKHSHEGDCFMFRYRTLSWSFYKNSMGLGKGIFAQSEIPYWRHPRKNSLEGYILKLVCERTK